MSNFLDEVVQEEDVSDSIISAIKKASIAIAKSIKYVQKQSTQIF